MNILTIINGDYGIRHSDNIKKYAPSTWNVEVWKAPNHFPVVIDYPEDFLPEKMPATDLILSFAEHRGVAELLPDIAKITGAKSVIAAVDNEAWLPRGLARQLRGWLEKIDVVCVTPKPLCSLTEIDYGTSRRKRIQYTDKYISEFATLFGQPEIRLFINPDSSYVESAEVIRDAVCGCARYVASGLINQTIDSTDEKAGLLHHHFPCLASMGIDSDFDDTLLHISGNIMKDNILEQIKPHLNNRYIRPGKMSSSPEE